MTDRARPRGRPRRVRPPGVGRGARGVCRAAEPDGASRVDGPRAGWPGRPPDRATTTRRSTWRAGLPRGRSERATCRRAARSAFWIGMMRLQRGELAVRPAAGSARASRPRRGDDVDCVERGYLLVPAALQALDAGDPAAALALFEQVAAIAERFDDRTSRRCRGWVAARRLIDVGEIDRGVALLDEAMRRRDGRRGLADRRRDRLLRVDRGVPRDLRPPPGPGVDGGADALVRLAARPRPVPRPLPRLPRRAPAVPRRVGRRRSTRRSAPRSGCCGRRPSRRSARRIYQQAELHRLRGRVRRGRARLSRGQPLGPPAGAGLALLRLAQGDGGRRGWR